MNRAFNRRDFLKRTAVTARPAATWSQRGAPTIIAADSPSEKLGVAVIGAGGMGGFSMDCGLREKHIPARDQFAGQGSKIQWDVEKMVSTNNAEVNQYVKREYRPGWEV